MDPVTDPQCHLDLAGDTTHGTGHLAGAGDIHTIIAGIGDIIPGGITRIPITGAPTHTDTGMAIMPGTMMDITEILMDGTTGTINTGATHTTGDV